MAEFSLLLRSLFFDEEGSGEKMELSLTASLTEEKEGFFAVYEDAANGLARTELFIKKGTPCVVKMQQPHTEVLFSEGKTYKTLYRIAGVGEMDFSVRTARVAADLSGERGGSLKLDYEATLGGARRRTVMMLEFTPNKEDAT